MQELGQLLLLVAFFATIATALTAVGGAVTRNPSLIGGARYGLMGVVGLNVAMALILLHGFMTHAFVNEYIATYSDQTMPTLYLVAAFWGGEKGALLFWVTALTVMGAVAMKGRRDRDPAYLGWSMAVLLGATLFFHGLMVFESSPFETFLASAAPTEGEGLNPLLQNPSMAFHPPSLLTGYITFTIPFAFGMGALISGKLDNAWIRDCRIWTIVCWCFLSIGLILGALWAYQELGWGFYWMWDPVENAGLIPWFTATAFLHSVMIQEKRGMLKRWNVVLVCLTFLLTILGTFLTRSQLIDSIHAFANSELSGYFLWYMGGLLLLSATTIAWRWRALRPEARIESVWSRESMFVMNNVFLVGCAFIVLWGTLFPKISELVAVRDAYNAVAGGWNATAGVLVGSIEPLQQSVSLGEPWFNRVMTPIGLVLLTLMGIGPLIPWRRATVRSFRRNFLNPLTVSVLLTVTGSLVLAGLRIRDLVARHDLSWGAAYARWADGLSAEHVYTVMAYLFCLFVGWTIIREFHVGTRVRQRRSGDPYAASLIGLVAKAPRRYGGYIVHFGVVLMFVAFTGKVFKQQLPERPMEEGDELAIDDYRLTFSDQDTSWNEDGGYVAKESTVTVLRRGETAAPSQVDELVSWLEGRDVGPFHVDTELGSPKMRVRFAEAEARKRVEEDVWLAREFTDAFQRVGRDEQRHVERWRVADDGVLRVMPMLAMRRIRSLEERLEAAATLDARVSSTPGSPVATIQFPSAEAMRAFDQRLQRLDVPDHVLYAGYDEERGAMAFVDQRTGMQLHPSVRFYARHDTPTTETAIASSFHEDLYIAMRPAMGKPHVNLLTVVFPMVSFLWAGALVLVLGTFTCLTPGWLARTLIVLARGPRRRHPDEPAEAGATPAGAKQGAAAAVAAGLLGLAAPADAAVPPADAIPDPPGVSAASGPDELLEAATRDVLSVLRCACGEGAAASPERSLSDEACECSDAASDRTLVRSLMAEQSEAAMRDGRAEVRVLRRLVEEVDPRWDARLMYDVEVYRDLTTTTKTTCPTEFGLVLSQSQIACSVRREWLPRFRRLLAAGVSPEELYRYYVDRNNATRAESAERGPWSYQDLRANPDKPLSWAFPGALAAFLLVGLGVYAKRRTRRRHADAAAEAQAQPSLSGRQRRLLDDELDLHEG